MKFGVVVFPGSNCDYDSYRAVKDSLNQQVEFIWHGDEDTSGFDAIILPGGFSYGDYLRAGAIASFSRIIASVKKFAENGGFVMGICNGFQVLTESGLLPGTLMLNTNLRFICRDIYLRTENDSTAFSSELSGGEVIRLPVAHNQGNYFCSDDVYHRLNDYGGIIFRYCTPGGKTTEDANPNGSRDSIAGIMNERGNVMGMMPHPERYVEDLLGGTDGIKIFGSLVNANTGRADN
ncbi:MAG: phosphoribosylformylglycinamidine synthase subunit PurQ [candidate division Zixibacteria bacterium]|nr:phosphoribosylformylglycinamidine synthase subunit PurQ [candidate division Zixibacteria bacterium]